MNNTQPQRQINSTAIFIAIIIAAVVVVVIGQAIAGEQFWTLVGGFAVLCATGLAVLAIGVWLYRIWSAAQCERDKLKFNFIVDMADKGIMLKGRGIPAYEQLTAPAIESDDPIDMHGVTNSTVAPYRQDAIEVVALSKQVMKQQPDQIVPIAKAKLVEYFAGKEGYTRWQNGCAWLLAHQWVEERKKGERIIGRFCTSGTVAQLYDRLKKSDPPTA